MKVRVTKKSASVQDVPITTEYIKLEALLKLVSVVGSGGMAKNIIQNGDVTVNGEVCLMRGKKLYPGDEVALLGSRFRVVSDET